MPGPPAGGVHPEPFTPRHLGDDSSIVFYLRNPSANCGPGDRRPMAAQAPRGLQKPTLRDQPGPSRSPASDSRRSPEAGSPQCLTLAGPCSRLVFRFGRTAGHSHPPRNLTTDACSAGRSACTGQANREAPPRAFPPPPGGGRTEDARPFARPASTPTPPSLFLSNRVIPQETSG